MPIRTERKPDGVRYLFTSNGKSYRSLDYHRANRSRPNKSAWSVPRSEEFDIFEHADSNDWEDGVRGYWGFSGHNPAEIGCNGERLALFPFKTDSADDWHGFPNPRLRDSPSWGFTSRTMAARRRHAVRRG